MLMVSRHTKSSISYINTLKTVKKLQETIEKISIITNFHENQ